MFATYPDMSHVFGYGSDMDEELRAHGLRIMRVIDHLLNSIFTNCNLECGEGSDILSKLGHKHCSFNVKPEYFTVRFFVKLVIDV